LRFFEETRQGREWIESGGTEAKALRIAIAQETRQLQAPPKEYPPAAGLPVEHSSKPWERSEPSPGPLIRIGIRGERKGKMAKICTVESTSPSLVEANARLIVMAPDLFEECETTLRDLDAFMKNQNAWRLNRARLRGLIEKVKGQQPPFMP